MKIERKARIMRSRGVVAILFLFVTVTASGMFATPCLGLTQSVPNKIADLKTGVSQAELMKMLAGAGKITADQSKDKRGPVVTWNLPDSPYFDDVSFRFTEKDRLFLIRFALKSSARQQFAAIKDDFFGKYDFSPERPFRLRRHDEDILLYGPNSGSSLYFLEFTNTKTGKKYYEVFNRTISGEDRPAVPPQQEGEKPPSVEKGAGEPAKAVDEKKAAPVPTSAGTDARPTPQPVQSKEGVTPPK